MKDIAIGQSQVSALKQKLKLAKQALAQITENQNDKLQVLLQFTTQLSLACKGQNSKLDNQLAHLRSRLLHIKSIDDVIPLIKESETTLEQQHSHITAQLEDCRVDLAKAVAKMQRIDSATPQLKHKIKTLKQELNKTFQTFWDCPPKLQLLVEYYDEILEEHLQNDKAIEALPHHKHLGTELSKIISEIDFKQEQRNQVDKIKATLKTDFQLDELMQAYQNTLTLIIDNIAREKSASQEFLFALNDTLNNVKRAVSKSHNHSQETYKTTQELNKLINSQVSKVDDSLIDIDDISELKLQVTEQLYSLRTALDQKEEIEETEQENLRKTVKAMTKELSDLAKETNSFKERLFEQQRISRLDALTQLPNRMALEERMENEYENSQLKGNSLWIAVADIDHFKSINDRFGHAIGDKALQVIAANFVKSLREPDFVGRFGGEEFVFLIPNKTKEQVDAILNQLREKIQHIQFKFKDQQITITISIGAALLEEGESSHDTFERADKALYQAKSENRNKVIIAQPLTH